MKGTLKNGGKTVFFTPLDPCGDDKAEEFEIDDFSKATRERTLQKQVEEHLRTQSIRINLEKTQDKRITILEDTISCALSFMIQYQLTASKNVVSPRSRQKCSIKEILPLDQLRKIVLKRCLASGARQTIKQRAYRAAEEDLNSKLIS